MTKKCGKTSLSHFTSGTNHPEESAEGTVSIISPINSLAANSIAKFFKCPDHKCEVFSKHRGKDNVFTTEVSGNNSGCLQVMKMSLK